MEIKNKNFITKLSQIIHLKINNNNFRIQSIEIIWNFINIIK
jgi:hypothetical protein